MKTITDDIEGFFDNGGWSFLDPESDEENAANVSTVSIMFINIFITSFHGLSSSYATHFLSI